MKPEVMIQQANSLPETIRDYCAPFAALVDDLLSDDQWRAIRRVYITGDGDSYHAARSVELAFENIARVPCEPYSAQHFLDYAAEWMPIGAPHEVLLLAISASGKTQRVVESIERARQYGALTIAVTGTPGSRLTEVADRALVVALPSLGPSPGIRTYNGSLLGLYLVAIRLGEAQGAFTPAEADALRAELAGLADTTAATLAAAEPVARAIVDALRAAETAIWVGSGPSYGTAMFGAAKVVEAAGLFHIGQDLEEWWHVERFIYPDNMPLFVIAPPGRSHGRAARLVRTARAIGHRIVAIVAEDDSEIAPLADFVLPVAGAVREEFSPLVYHVATNLVASYWAEALGRMLFHSDDPVFRANAMQ